MNLSVSCIEVPRALLTLNTTLASTACFIFAALAVGLWTHHRGPISGAARAIRWHNRMYAAVSVVMLGLIVQFSVRRRYVDATCVVGGGGEGGGGAGSTQTVVTLVPLAPLVYHCSKFHEYLDVILVLANHHGPSSRSLSQQPIDLHFGFHHLTTPYLTWYRIIVQRSSSSSGPGWEVFAVLNCVHHAIMYSFFGSGGWEIWGLEPETLLRKVLPWTGGLQLVAGIGMEVKVLVTTKMAESNNTFAESTGDNLRGHWIALVLLSTYLVLYMRDLRRRAGEKPAATRKKQD